MTNKEKLAEEFETRPDVLRRRKKYEWLGWPIAVIAVWGLLIAPWPFNLVMANDPDCGSSVTQESVIQFAKERPDLTFNSPTDIYLAVLGFQTKLGLGTMTALNSTLGKKLAISLKTWGLNQAIGTDLNPRFNSQIKEMLEKAKQETIFSLDTIRTKSKNTDTKAVSCIANLIAAFEDGNTHEEVNYTVEKTSDGKLYVTLYGL